VDFTNPAEVGHHECQLSQKHGFGTDDAVLHEDGVPGGNVVRNGCRHGGLCT